VLNVRQRHDGYLSGNDYLVIWSFGHLVQLAMPDAYGFTGFRREHLPIIPQEFKFIPRRIWEGKGKSSLALPHDRMADVQGSNTPSTFNLK